VRARRTVGGLQLGVDPADQIAVGNVADEQKQGLVEVAIPQVMARPSLDLTQTTRMVRPATGPAAALTLFKPSAERIDARQFNSSFPQTFPRFVQYAIWRYCSQSGLDVCNGNRIDDNRRCESKDCRVRLMCDRVVLRKAATYTPGTRRRTRTRSP
jgi:hypothetical protein